MCSICVARQAELMQLFMRLGGGAAYGKKTTGEFRERARIEHQQYVARFKEFLPGTVTCGAGCDECKSRALRGRWPRHATWRFTWLVPPQLMPRGR